MMRRMLPAGTQHDASRPRTVLLAGASGAIGQRLQPALVAAGHTVRCLTRDAARASARLGAWDWRTGDVHDRTSLQRAAEGCDAAFYLVHEMGQGSDYAQREETAAENMAAAAASAGLARIVYLGGVMPRDARDASAHLRSRARVGEILRSGGVPALELRASMIIGAASLSFRIVRDLAARLPFMILPRWLESRTEPVAMHDVIIALQRSLDVRLERSAMHDIPGPEAMSGRAILIRTAHALDLHSPAVLRVPVLTPRLSSLWLRFVTQADWEIAKEIVVGLRTDLLAADANYWEMIGHTSLVTFEDAARAAEAEIPRTDGLWGRIERLRIDR